MDFYKLVRECGFNREAIAEYLDVTEQTVRRWEKTNRPPKAVFLLLDVLSGGLGFVSDEFKGFYFFKGDLYTPENEAFRAGEIRAIKYYQHAIKHYQNKGKSKSVQHGRYGKVFQFKELNSRK